MVETNDTNRKVRMVILILLNMIMIIWGGSHLYHFFKGDAFVIRGIVGVNAQYLILPVTFGILIAMEIYLIMKHGINHLLDPDHS